MLCKDLCEFLTIGCVKTPVDSQPPPWLRCVFYLDLDNIVIEQEKKHFECQSKFAFSTRIKRITHKCALKLTSSDFSMRSSGQSRNFLPVTMPALLMRIETSPTSFLTWIGWEECHHQSSTSVYDLFPNIYIVLIRTSGWIYMLITESTLQQ